MDDRWIGAARLGASAARAVGLIGVDAASARFGRALPATPEQLARLRQAVTIEEQWREATQRYLEAANKAEATNRQFGKGTEALDFAITHGAAALDGSAGDEILLRNTNGDTLNVRRDPVAGAVARAQLLRAGLPGLQAVVDQDHHGVAGQPCGPGVCLTVGDDHPGGTVTHLGVMHGLVYDAFHVGAAAAEKPSGNPGFLRV